MENKSGKIIAIVALAVAVVALSVGFAAFADTLTINGTATTTANGNAFDDTTTGGLRYKSGSAKCYLTSDNTKAALANATVGTLDDDSWSGIMVPLGDSANNVTCEAVVENNTNYIAYLTTLASNGPITCASDGANATANANAVCAATTVNVAVSTNTNDKITFSNTAATLSPGNGNIAANGTATVTVNIVYAGATTDNDVTITLPTITHDYSSVSNTGN